MRGRVFEYRLDTTLELYNFLVSFLQWTYERRPKVILQLALYVCIHVVCSSYGY